VGDEIKNKNMKIKLLKSLSLVNILTLIAMLALPMVYFTQKAEAANFQQTFVRLDRLKAASTTTGLVCAKPATTLTTSNINVSVTFPSAFTSGVSATTTKWAATGSTFGGATAWPGIATATIAVSAPTVTWTYTAQTLTAGTTYCFTWADATALTNPAAGNYTDGTISDAITGPTVQDSSGLAFTIVSQDQILINATVPPTFTLTFTGGADNFASLSTTTSSTTGKTAQISTNAPNGWDIWVKSANAGLTSPTGGTIATFGTINATPDDLASGSNYGYVLDADKTLDGGGTGTVTIDPEYNGTNTTSGGTLSSASFQSIATSNGTTDGDTVTIIERARVSAIQKAANDYADTLTVVAAGMF
jgi:hypothetical protein